MKVFRATEDEQKISQFLDEDFGAGQYKIYPLAGDASTRRYYRIIKDETSYVVMAWEPYEDSSDFPFLSVHDLFSKAKVQVPEIVKKSPELGLMLLEDLGDLTLERKFWENQSQELCLPFYQLAMDELAKIHFTATRTDTNSTAFTTVFDKEKLLWELNYGRKHLIENICKVELSDTESKSMDSIFGDVSETLANQKKVVCHRDYHSRNVMIKFGKMRVIDFQDARMGPKQYDLVSLLKDSYVNLGDKIETYLIDYYFDQAREFNFELESRDEFMEMYHLQTIQRCFKACGSFASFKVQRDDNRYVKYLSPTLQRVKQALLHFPKFSAFNEILEQYGIYDHDFKS